MTDEADDEPKGDVIELNVEDLPCFAAVWKADRTMGELLLKEHIFRVVHQHDVAHKPETLAYQEMQFLWLTGRVVEQVQLKAVKK